MTDRPIIFSAPMVRALLEGRKTQTRRLADSPLRLCEVGDRLWVRESWFVDHIDCQRGPYLAPDGMSHNELVDDGWLHFMATNDPRIWEAERPTWRPSIHMPRWASRLTLIVQSLKIEPLQAISEEDAMAEGAARLVVDDEGTFFQHDQGTHVCGYAGLWDHLHDKPGERWEDNPDVLALTFRVIRSNIDQAAA